MQCLSKSATYIIIKTKETQIIQVDTSQINQVFCLKIFCCHLLEFNKMSPSDVVTGENFALQQQSLLRCHRERTRRLLLYCFYVLIVSYFSFLQQGVPRTHPPRAARRARPPCLLCLLTERSGRGGRQPPCRGTVPRLR